MRHVEEPHTPMQSDWCTLNASSPNPHLLQSLRSPQYPICCRLQRNFQLYPLRLSYHELEQRLIRAYALPPSHLGLQPRPRETIKFLYGKDVIGHEGKELHRSLMSMSIPNLQQRRRREPQSRVVIITHVYEEAQLHCNRKWRRPS